MTTDTTRTDAARERYFDGKTSDWVHYTIAMMLEQELNASQAEVERLKDSLHDCLSFLEFHGAVGATPDTAMLLQKRLLATLQPTDK
jgi:hypothetical protein